jgi:hypothetical protein
MNRWRCRRYQTRLVDCAEGTLSGPERQRLERHLAHWPWRAVFTTAAAAALVALTVYHFAERPPAPQRTSAEPALTALDAGSLAMLHDFMEALAPNDGEIQSDRLDDETLLAALPIDDLVGVNVIPAVPQAGDLNEEELESIGDLVGGIG